MQDSTKINQNIRSTQPNSRGVFFRTWTFGENLESFNSSALSGAGIAGQGSSLLEKSTSKRLAFLWKPLQVVKYPALLVPTRAGRRF